MLVFLSGHTSSSPGALFGAVAQYFERLRCVQMSLVDEVIRVSTDDAMATARKAALKHGLLVCSRSAMLKRV